MRWMLMFVVVFSTPSYGMFAPSVGVEVIVVDESSKPIEGAEVIGTFLGVTDFDEQHVFTDGEGRVLVSGRSYFPVGVAVIKSGFYGSAKEVNIKEVVNGKENYPDRKVTLVLKEKRNPIPLYAKRYSGEIPVAGEWIGFDLEGGDWVAPYGKGSRSDLEFWYQGSVASYLDINAELRMRFPTSGDGLHDVSDTISNFSELKVSREAPEDGYVGAEKIWRLVVGGQKPEGKYKASKSNYYFLRLRSARGAEGEIVESNYAKIYRDVWFSPKALKKGVSKLLFTYYFNPTPNDRNLEFDTYRNLFKNLPHEEQVREP